jgi:hypothetical protein
MWSLLVHLVALSPVAVETFAFETVAEKSNAVQTGGLTELDDFCEHLQTADQRCEVFGTTAGGEPMRAVLLGQPISASTPAVLVMAGIHAGEIEGKDAIFTLIKSLLSGNNRAGLDQLSLVFVPVYNVDGFARFGANQRPNQRGPERTGWRTNALNLNLNRDWLKVDAPETAALIELANRIDPVVIIDLHTTDGAKFQHDVAIVVEPQHDDQSLMAEPARRLRATTLLALQKMGHRPLGFYPSFEVDDEPGSGIVGGVTPARFTHGYFAQRDVISVLVENHAWRTYAERIRSSLDVCQVVLQQAQSSGRQWLRTRDQARGARQRMAGREVTVRFTADDRSTVSFPFLGYAYRREPSAVSGTLWTEYDEQSPQTWMMPLTLGVKPELKITAPMQGYWIDAAYATRMASLLRTHGITFVRSTSTTPMTMRQFVATEVSFSAAPYEGRQTATMVGGWQPRTVSMRKGSLYIPIYQPRSRLVIELFEPAAKDSLAGWGFFNAHFEDKEYLEDYVAEAEARTMLANDKALQTLFMEKLHDPAFARDPAKRLRFFADRHPSADQEKNHLPVFRCEQPSCAARP